ncbi:MAG: hypothetical protein OHK0029_05300 [Armatimonadaceae bacterium]
MVPVALVVLLTLLAVPFVVKGINEAQLTNRFFEMGKYYKVHMKNTTLWAIDTIRDEKDPKERALPLAFLELPVDSTKKSEVKFLMTKLLLTRDVDARNKYVDAFVAGFESP